MITITFFLAVITFSPVGGYLPEKRVSLKMEVEGSPETSLTTYYTIRDITEKTTV
jgi:hypothetical protein